MTKRETLKPDGRILYLTEDADLLKSQLYDSANLEFDADRKLIDNISTDEITPGWVCYYYDETLARYSLVGLRGGHVKADALIQGGFGVIVSGLSKGCGSSRETAPFSEAKAGIKLVIAKSIEKIYGQNCQNIGLLTSTDFGLIERIRNGEAIPIAEFTKGLDPIATAIVEHGGLFAYNKARLGRQRCQPPTLSKPRQRPMTLCEKIIARRAIADAKTGALGESRWRCNRAMPCSSGPTCGSPTNTSPPMAESPVQTSDSVTTRRVHRSWNSSPCSRSATT